LDLLRNMGGTIDPRNYSFLFVTGEMIAAAVMVHTLQQAGIPAVALTGGMAGIITEDFHMSAQVVRTDRHLIRRYLEQKVVPVVCGGQGITQSAGDFAILGRNSSDASGVLVGIMADAERADIYTDVECTLATDPRIVPDAPKRPYVSYAAAFEMARFGARVIHASSVRLGMEHNLPIRVRSTFSQDPGTLIGPQEDEWPLVGLPLLGPVQVAVLPSQDLDEPRRLAMEQHVGLLSLLDEISGEWVFCAPMGDTTSVVNKELADNGFGPVTWQPGYSLVSLIGAQGALPAINKQAERILEHRAICHPYHEVTPRRATFVVPETQAKAALMALYDNFEADLGG
jgi:aspartate kinase